MKYIMNSEIVLYAPEVGDFDEIAEPTGQRRYIIAASQDIDIYCGGGLGIREYFNEKIPLNQNFTGKLRAWPFIEWIGETGTITRLGAIPTGGTPITLADFDVIKTAGVIVDLNRNYQVSGTLADPHWRDRSSSIPFNSPFLETMDQFHAGSLQTFQDNSTPLRLEASYRAGFFAEKVIQSSGQVSPGVVIPVDVTHLAPGREMYFSSDPDQEDPVLERFITAIDPDTRQVSFSPSLDYDLPAGATLRMIDGPVRSACAQIIADRLVYGVNTKQIREGLGKRDLETTLVRANAAAIPDIAAMKLGAYLRG